MCKTMAPGCPRKGGHGSLSPSKASPGGTGLGLYLARRLAEALGGRVFLEAGEGARFAFALPLEVDHADPGGG
jgi:signal transduction histidine kinase